MDLLHELVKDQWKLDSLGKENINKSLSRENIRTKNILDKTMKRVGDYFKTGLLWKDADKVLPESRINAMRRLQYTGRKMDKDKMYGKTYCDKMGDLEKKKYIRKLSEEELTKENPKIW